VTDITVVQHDTDPSILGHLTNPDGSDFDLTGCTVKFQMRAAGYLKYTVNAAATVAVAATGHVRYDWANTDLNIPGDYQCQWEVTFANGKVQTTDPVNTVTVRRE
jgi:hypothetical protein